MTIDWTKQPTPEHCWLESVDQCYTKESGWYVLDGNYWLHEIKVPWFVESEGTHFTVHRKPEEYVPKGWGVVRGVR